MRKTILMGMMALGAFSLFAQKANVNKALTYVNSESELKSADITEAKSLINAALEDPEAATEAKTWYVAGMVYFKEYEAEVTKALKGKTDDNEKKKGRSVITSLDHFIYADELDSKPNAKGKVKPRYREEIKGIITTTYRGALINYGVYSYNQNDMKSAIKAFEKYLEIPTLPMMQGDETVTKDSLIATIKEYYEDSQIRLANNILTEKNDTAAYFKAIKSAYDKNPDSPLIINALIDYYSIMKKDAAKALEFVEKAIAQNPNNVVYYKIKGQLLIRLEQSEQASAAFAKVTELEPDSKDGFIGQANVFSVAGDRLIEEANAIKDNKAYEAKREEAKAVYAKAIPFLEKIRSIDPQDKQNLQILRQVYYNVEGDSDNYKKITQEIEALK